MFIVWLVLFGAGVLSYTDSSRIDWPGLGATLIAAFLFGCLVLLFFQKTHVRVDSTGVSLRHGPLPGTKRATRVNRSDIARCIYHHVRRMPSGGGPYWNAGVVTTQGRFVEVLSPFWDAAAAKAAAEEIASALGPHAGRWLTCELATSWSYEPDTALALRLLGWLCIVVAGFAGAATLELAR